MREAVAGLDVELVPLGSAIEGPGFSDGVRTARITGHPLDGADLVVLPAFVEHGPRRLLEAIARGIPVVATDACGIAPGGGITRVPMGDADALRAAIVAVLETPPDGVHFASRSDAAEIIGIEDAGDVRLRPVSPRGGGWSPFPAAGK